MSESAPKHRKLWSASQLQHYSKERVTRNFIPNAITVRGILPVEEREKLTVASGQGSLLFKERSWQGQVHAFRRVSGVLLLPERGSDLQFSVFLVLSPSIPLYCWIYWCKITQKHYALLSPGYLLISKIFISISSTYLMNLTFLYFYIQKHSPNPNSFPGFF